ncbi:hypothetical protein [Rhodopirellula sp. MGV]|nr:hypothetical protein [Rhodopirellula sp. MGV]
MNLSPRGDDKGDQNNPSTPVTQSNAPKFPAADLPGKATETA